MRAPLRLMALLCVTRALQQPGQQIPVPGGGMCVLEESEVEELETGQWWPLVRVDALGTLPRVYFAGTRRVLLVRLRDGELRAVADACPHAGSRLSQGSFAGDCVTCPRHGWVFSLRDGACAEHPVYRLRTYPLRVEAGAVEVWVAEVW